MKKLTLLFILCFAFFFHTLAEAAITTRIKDATRIEGLRYNQLIGYGLVIGLEGTGDSKGTKATIRSIVNMLETFGVRVTESEMKGGNIAAVMVTAKLAPYSRVGDNIDVLVSSIGDASSLQGGLLLMTPLRAANGDVFAVAQGSISLGGFKVGSGGSKVQKGHPTVGMIPAGAIVERGISFKLFRDDLSFNLALIKPDFTTAVNIAKIIKHWNPKTMARAIDAKSVEIYIPLEYQDQEMIFLSELEQLQFTPDQVAKIIINERTGTLLMGGPIKILPTAVAHGNLKIEINEQKAVSQPQPFAQGETKETAQSAISVEEGKANIVRIAPGNTVNDVIEVLNTIGVSPKDMIIILQTMRSAGALQAELEII